MVRVYYRHPYAIKTQRAKGKKCPESRVSNGPLCVKVSYIFTEFYLSFGFEVESEISGDGRLEGDDQIRVDMEDSLVVVQ